MNIQLINGEFSSNDTLELITQLINTKIKYHENKIVTLNNEEDIKSRETKIKHLQNELSALKTEIVKNNGNLKLEATISLEK